MLLKLALCSLLLLVATCEKVEKEEKAEEKEEPELVHNGVDYVLPAGGQMTKVGIFVEKDPKPLPPNGIGPITPDFRSFLNTNGYISYNFPRDDMSDYGSFGGRAYAGEPVKNTPVIFFHGNSDSALQANNFSSGFTNTVNYFLANGYTLAELYATSWGTTNTSTAIYRDHDCFDVLRLREFVKAVLQYTGKSQVNIISHSMGVTLGRKVIQGGTIDADDGYNETLYPAGICQVGTPLTNKVGVFLGLAGTNYGLCTCVGAVEEYPTCNRKNGFWPGDSCGSNDAANCGTNPLPSSCSNPQYSKYLMDLNTSMIREGQKVFSVWSRDDDLILYGDSVWGRQTSFIPLSDGQLIYTNMTHMQLKELTAPDQYYIITHGALPPVEQIVRPGIITHKEHILHYEL